MVKPPCPNLQERENNMTSQDQIYAVYGASGYGKEVMPLLQKQVGHHCTIYFIDDAMQKVSINETPVITFNDFLTISARQKFVVIAIASSVIREKLSGQLLKHGISIFNIQSDNAVVMDTVKLSDGYILSPFVTLTSNIKIGKYFHANLYSYVAHDCIIGDFVTFAPRVSCNGNIHIHDHAYIGTGAVIKQGTPDKPLIIGKGAVVGMGAVVTKDVPAGAVVVGNPARVME